MNQSLAKISHSPQLHLSAKATKKTQAEPESLDARIGIFKRHGSFSSKPNSSLTLPKQRSCRRKFLFLQTETLGTADLINHKSDSFHHSNINSWRGAKSQVYSNANSSQTTNQKISTKALQSAQTIETLRQKISLPFKSPHPVKQKNLDIPYMRALNFKKKPDMQGALKGNLEQYIFRQSQKLDQRQDLSVKIKQIEKNFASSHKELVKQKLLLLKNFGGIMQDLNCSAEQNHLMAPPKSHLTLKPHQKTTSIDKQRSSVSLKRPFNPDNCVIVNPKQLFAKKQSNACDWTTTNQENKNNNELEFNKGPKILNIIEHDKKLNLSRKAISDKIKDLGRGLQKKQPIKLFDLPQDETCFCKEYKIHSTLGKGTYGDVKLVSHVETSELFAVKIYPKKYLKDSIKRENIENEIHILSLISHPNIIRFYKSIEGSHFIYIVTEYAGQKSLHQVLTQGTVETLSEVCAKPLIFQIASAIDYLHSSDIIHRDIKLHNILVSNGVAKLIDFGFAVKTNEKTLLKIFCGTPSYMSPEIIQRTPYRGKPCDMWALGICIYRIIFGRFPFRG